MMLLEYLQSYGDRQKHPRQYAHFNSICNIHPECSYFKCQEKLYYSASHSPTGKIAATVTKPLWLLQYSHCLDHLCLRSTSDVIHFSNRHFQTLKHELSSFRIALLESLEWNQCIPPVWRTNSPFKYQKIEPR